MELTEKKLEELKACSEGIEWWKTLKTTSLRLSLETAVNAEKYYYVSWLLPRLMKKNEDRVKFAVYAARLVLDIFEKQCAGDNRPRLAIEAAEEWLKHKTKKNAAAADAAADAANAAADAANADYYSDDAAAHSAAADAARSAYYAANADYYSDGVAAAANAANAANAAAYAAYYVAANANANANANVANAAANANAYAYAAARKEIYRKLINYGLKLIGGN